MAHFLSTENSNYINKNIEIYTKNKVGQFSKYLNSNPIFVTYYSLSDANIRADSGTGGIQEEIGRFSPLRFNKIESFPLYNIPDLKPQLQYDEKGLDIELDLSDVTVLPNTIKPKFADYFIIDIPNVKQLMFRVNNFNYNTIQSNDFYMLDCDLKEIGNNLYSKLEDQIIDTYICVFENIGTDNNCFILKSDINRIKSIEKVILELRSIYTSLYYNKELNLFWNRTGKVTKDGDDMYYYDLYLTRFINESKIFQNDFDTKSIVLTYDDNVPSNFEFLWRKTLWYAILINDYTFLEPRLYDIPNLVTKRFSPINLYGYTCETTDLIDFHKNLPLGFNEDENIPLSYYFSNCLITSILNEEYNMEGENLSYLEKIIYRYLKRINLNDIDVEKIEKNVLSHNKNNFKYIPIVIYILIKIHDEYFTRNNFIFKKG